MKRTPLRKIGKRGKINQEYKKLLSQMDLPDYCEMRLEGCLGNFTIAPAHRHKRLHYKTAEELADYNQIIIACVNCHDKTEHNRELNEEIFKRLRGYETN